jgi:hypothetical protein
MRGVGALGFMRVSFFLMSIPVWVVSARGARSPSSCVMDYFTAAGKQEV